MFGNSAKLVKCDSRSRFFSGNRVTAALSIGVASLVVFSLGSYAQEADAPVYRKVAVVLPQNFKELLGARRYGPGDLNGATFGYGCNRGEEVKTCDLNTSTSMPKGSTFFSGKLKLGPASNTAFLGIKRKSTCTATVTSDFSGVKGCVYAGCLGYKKPVTMLCMARGASQ
jgi:hypothetical protein